MAKKKKLEPPAIATALRSWREAKGWSRRQAAEHLGVKVRTLESWEYGYRKPPALHALERLWAPRPRRGA